MENEPWSDLHDHFARALRRLKRDRKRGLGMEAVRRYLNSETWDKSVPLMSATIIPLKRGSMTTSLAMASTPSASVPNEMKGKPIKPYFPTTDDWNLMLEWGKTAVKSGLLPYGIKTPEAAAIIALKGRELDIPFMIAIAHIHIIQGKPCMSAEMMQALARRNLVGLVINCIESTNEKCVIEFIRPEKGAKAFTGIFTIDDAKRANLLNKEVWKQYPAAMLWSRCISASLRKVCPEALMGISYTPEEMGNDDVNDVIETTGHVVVSEKPKDDPKPESPQPKPTLPDEPWDMPPAAASADQDIGQAAKVQLTQPQIARLYAIAKEAGIPERVALKQLIKDKYGHESTLELSTAEYNEFCGYLQTRKAQ